MSEDYYVLLGVNRNASQDELKKAYHKLAMKYHPDRVQGNSEYEQKFKKINHAYDVLKDPQKRAAYDQLGHDGFERYGTSGAGSSHGGFSGAPDMDDIFSSFFGDVMGSRGGGHRTSSWQSRGSDLKYDISINLEEAFKGGEHNINFTSYIPCNTCNGSGDTENSGVSDCNICHGRGVQRIKQGFFTLEQTCGNCAGQGKIIRKPCRTCHGHGRYQKNRNLLVTIPAGIENGTKIRLMGEGEAGVHNGQSGDLYVFVHIKAHDIYKVEGANLHCKFPINFTTACLGGEVEVPTIDGQKVLLKVPAGVQTGDKLSLNGYGMSKVRSSSRGNLIVHTYVEIPKNLTKKQKELLEELDKEFAHNNRSDDTGFFNKMKNLWL